MADRYRAYPPPSSHGRDPRSDYPGYLPPESTLPSYYPSRAPIVPGDYASRAPILPGDYASRAPILPSDYASRAPLLPDDYTSRAPVLPGGPDILRNDVPSHSRAYGVDGAAVVTNPALPGVSGLAAGARAPGHLEDPTLPGRSGAPAKAPVEESSLVSRSSSLGKGASIPDVEHHSPLPNLDGPSEDESNILFVDGLPSDCTRRESGDKAYVLCFVEFENAKYAFTAMEALQEYRFDDRKPDAPVLKIHFARFPFRLPAAEDDKKRRIAH
ncbi:hypothetical protein EJB05_46252, partial [Eragrostis curvula]